MSGPAHLGPSMPIPTYVPAPSTMARAPPVPPLVGAPLARAVPFGQPLFDPVFAGEDLLSRSVTPPMSKEEFYRYQKKMKAR